MCRFSCEAGRFLSPQTGFAIRPRARAVAPSLLLMLLLIAGTAPAQETASLEFKWTPGHRFLYRMETDSASSFTLPQTPGMPSRMDSASRQLMEYGFTVLNPGPEEENVIVIEYSRIRMEQDLNGQRTVYDSADAPEKRAAQGMKDNVYDALVGKRVRVLLTGDNQVKEIQGYESIMEEALASVPEHARKMLRDNFDVAFIGKLFEQGIASAFPRKQVTKGESWVDTKDVPLPVGGTLQTSTTTEFTGFETHRERNCVRLDFTGTLHQAAENGQNPMGMDVRVENGVSTGTTWFDPALGQIVENRLEQAFDLNIAVAMPNGQGKHDFTGKSVQTVVQTLVAAETVPVPEASSAPNE